MKTSPYHPLSSLTAKIFSSNFLKNQAIKKQCTLKMEKFMCKKNGWHKQMVYRSWFEAKNMSFFKHASKRKAKIPIPAASCGEFKFKKDNFGTIVEYKTLQS